MLTADTVKTKLLNLIAKSNRKTGAGDVDLTGAINHLILGYGMDYWDGTGVVIEKTAEVSQLDAPNISITDSILTIVDESTLAELFVILADGAYATVTPESVFDLTTLDLIPGKHKISVIAIAEQYEDSPESAILEYVVPGELIQLKAPIISVKDNVLTIVDAEGLAQQFDILVNGVVRREIDYPIFDLDNLELDTGTYRISVISKADGYTDSEESNSIQYAEGTIYTSNFFLSDGTLLYTSTGHIFNVTEE